MVIIALASLIVSILNLTHKKQPSRSRQSLDGYFLQQVLIFAGSGDLHSPSGSLVKHIINPFRLFVKSLLHNCKENSCHCFTVIIQGSVYIPSLMVCIICPDNCYNSKHQCCSSNNPNHNHRRRKISNPSSHKDCRWSVASRQHESPCARRKKLPCVQQHEHTSNAQRSAADNPFNHSFPLTPLTCSFFFVCTTKKPENLDF